MNELLKVMAKDMDLQFYDDESLPSYAYRIIYSALGLWCLHSAASIREGTYGMSKKGLTRAVNALLKEYLDLARESEEFLVHSPYFNLGQFIRNVYEETGYIITLENNRDILNTGQETISISKNLHLHLGLPDTDYKISGLGIYTCESGRPIFLYDLLIRDDLSPRQYVALYYDPLDFKPCPFGDLLFFDIESNEKLSRSWRGALKSRVGIAKSSDDNTIYRVMKSDRGKLFYAPMPPNRAGEEHMSGFEDRRLYIALKYCLGHPMIATFQKIDRQYTQLIINGDLPNREYYFLLLSAWPKNGFTDRHEFIMENTMVELCTEMLKRLGYSIEQ